MCGINCNGHSVVLDVNYQPTIRKLLTALRMNGRRYVVDTRQSWSKYDKPCKVYIVSRMYSEAEYAKAFPEKYKHNPFKEGQLFKKVAEYDTSKPQELLIYLVNVLKGGERSE